MVQPLAVEPAKESAPVPKHGTTGRRLALTRRNMNDKTVELVANLDLTTQAAGRSHVKGKIQHVLFHHRRSPDCVGPGGVDVHVTGRAGAGTAALGNDPWHTVHDGVFHHGRTVLGLDLIGRAVCFFDVGNSGHDLRPAYICGAGTRQGTDSGRLLFVLRVEHALDESTALGNRHAEVLDALGIDRLTVSQF